MGHVLTVACSCIALGLHFVYFQRTGTRLSTAVRKLISWTIHFASAVHQSVYAIHMLHVGPPEIVGPSESIVP